MIDKIKKNKSIEAFAMIVDINRFTSMVNKGEESGLPTAQFIRDILSGYIQAVQKNDGIIVGFMGDAFLALLETADQVFNSCIGIANDVDKSNEYLNEDKEIWPLSNNGLKVKIGIEYGHIDVSDISSSFLGSQKLFIGTPINFASRITGGGRKEYNRCLFGPKAFDEGLNSWPYEGPNTLTGKSGEEEYKFYELDLKDIWRNDSTENSLR